MKTDNKSYDLKNRSVKVNFGSKSLHRKKSDVFMPTSMPQINWNLVNSEESVCSQLSLVSKEGKKNEKGKKADTIRMSEDSKKQTQILFKKLKLHL